MADCRVVEEALKDSEERFRTIFDNLRDGLLLADKETKKFLMGNPAIHQMFGYSSEELKHLGLTDIHPEQGRSAFTMKTYAEETDGISRARDLGAVDYLVKPIDAKILKTALKNAVQKRRSKTLIAPSSPE